MPRPQKATTALRSEVVQVRQPEQQQGFVASATNLGAMPTIEQRAKLRAESWQGDVWTFYDLLPEFRYSCDWVGNTLSKARLIVQKDGKETTDATAVEGLEALFGSPEGRQEMLRQLGIHFTTAGEAYVIGYQDAAGDDDWLVAAASMTSFGIDNAIQVDDETFTSALAIRLWRPHPRRRRFSNSPSRAVLPILSELHGLGQHVAAQIDSRLAGAGLLLLPSEISLAAPPVVAAEGEEEPIAAAQQSSADVLIDKMMKTMSTAIADRSDPSALVPIVLQVAGEFVDKVKHIKFWSELDAHAIELRNEAIRRLALGMDMPPEVLEGQADLNHWSSWQVEEAAIKSHTEPLLAVITQSLTTGYLHPFLISEGMDPDEARTYSLGADTTQMRVRPNRSKEAQELHALGLLNAAAVIRENGFDPEIDMMSPDELKVFFMRKVASGSTTPQLVEAALRALDIFDDSMIVRPPNDEVTQEARPQPSLAEHPDRGAPTTEEVNDSLTAASYMLVDRALERAGNRLKTKAGGRKFTAAAATIYQTMRADDGEIDDLLDGAWDACHRYSGMLHGIDAARWANALDGYTRGLLQRQEPVDPDMLRVHLLKAAA